MERNRDEREPIKIEINRSRFKLSERHTTTFESGKLVPLLCKEIIPGDTFNISTSIVARTLTPMAPVLDNAYLDYYYFFVPTRIIAPWNGDSWQEINGENTKGYWKQSEEKTITPMIINTNGEISGLPIYLGYPAKMSEDCKINPYPLIGYTLIWDEWFRNQNTQPPELTIKSNKNLENYYKNNGMELLNVNKFKDQYTNCTLEPQKGKAVQVPLGDSAPLFTTYNGGRDLIHPVQALEATQYLSPVPYSFENKSANNLILAMKGSGLGYNQGTLYGTTTTSSSPAENNIITSSNLAINLDNIKVDLSKATAATINQLRESFAIQGMLELDTKGTRYREILYNHFGVSIPDSTVQIPEYLGGKSIPLNVSQVLQTTPVADIDSPTGTTGAYSLTSNNDETFVKSFNEHGYLYCVACVRTEQSYSQGVDKMFTRFRRYDFYDPLFANIGEQPIYKDEIFVNQGSQIDFSNKESREILGYNEAWIHYRTQTHRVSGALAPNAEINTFIPWTYTNDFETAPTLNSEFVSQSKENLGRTLVDQATRDQILIDFLAHGNMVRPMPLYSTPGLLSVGFR